MQHSIPDCPVGGGSMRSAAPSRRTLGARSAAVCGLCRYCRRCRPTTPVTTPQRRLLYLPVAASSIAPTADTTVSPHSHPIHGRACLHPPVGRRHWSARPATLGSIHLTRSSAQPTTSRTPPSHTVPTLQPPRSLPPALPFPPPT